MSAATKPPEPKTYCFVLRTYRPYDPQIVRLASTYWESQESRDITHPDGQRRPTIFISHEHSKSFLEKQGWEDVTHLWPTARGLHEPIEPAREPGPLPNKSITLAV